MCVESYTFVSSSAANHSFTTATTVAQKINNMETTVNFNQLHNSFLAAFKNKHQIIIKRNTQQGGIEVHYQTGVIYTVTPTGVPVPSDGIDNAVGKRHIQTCKEVLENLGIKD